MKLKEVISQVGLVLISTTLLRFWIEGKLTQYIHPSTVYLVVVAAGILLILAVVRSANAHTHATNYQILSLILVAMLMVVVRNVPLSVSLAKDRNVGGTAAISSRSTIRINQSTASFSLLDWVSVWNQSPDHSHYLGEPVNAQGFILTQGGQKYVYRMLITCCIVDAQPVSIALTGAPTPKEGTWVDVIGKMDQQSGLPLIKVTAINQVSVPTDTYLY